MDTLNTTVSKKDLIESGYCNNQAKTIIRMAKDSMVQDGYTFYRNRRIDRVPKSAVEKVIGIDFGGM